MNRKQIPALLLAAALLLLVLCSCRVRTTGIGEIPVPRELTAAEPSDRQEEPQEPEPRQEEMPALPDVPEEVPPDPEPEPEPEPPALQAPEIPPEQPPEEPEPDAPSLENPEADRREYTPDAPAVEDPGAETPVQTEPVPDAPPAPAPAPEGEETGEVAGNLEGESGEQSVTVTVPSEEAEQLGEAQEAEEASSMREYYQTLLDDRLGNQFECQRLYVYWETEEDWVTVLRSSPEHQIISNAGGYSVSAKLLEENLTVDGGWVSRKNPGAIVKWVDSSVLGSGVTGTAEAETVRNAMLARPELAETDAVRSGRVLLLSRELKDSETGRLAAALFTAQALYTDSFADVDPEEALNLLSQEAGTPVSGLYAFAG